MHSFYLSMDCRNCGEEILYGVCATTIENSGLPVIPFDMASQTQFDCGNCDAENFTGDFYVSVEGGDDEN